MITKDDARKLFCPFKQGLLKCRAHECMGWEVWKEDERWGYCRSLGKGATPPKPPKTP